MEIERVQLVKDPHEMAALIEVSGWVVVKINASSCFLAAMSNFLKQFLNSSISVTNSFCWANQPYKVELL